MFPKTGPSFFQFLICYQLKKESPRISKALILCMYPFIIYIFVKCTVLTRIYTKLTIFSGNSSELILLKGRVEHGRIVGHNCSDQQRIAGTTHVKFYFTGHTRVRIFQYSENRLYSITATYSGKPSDK